MIRKGFWISEATIHDRKLQTIILRDMTERARIEAEMAARTQQEGAVADLSRQALAGQDLEWLFDKTDAAVAEALEVEFSKVLELSRSGDELVLRAGVGRPKGCVGVSRVPGEGTQASYTLQMGEPVLMEDPTRETRFRAATLLLDPFSGERNERRGSRTRSALRNSRGP